MGFWLYVVKFLIFLITRKYQVNTLVFYIMLLIAVTHLIAMTVIRFEHTGQVCAGKYLPEVPLTTQQVISYHDHTLSMHVPD